MSKHSKILTKTIDEQAEDVHNEITQAIINLQNLLNSNDVCLIHSITIYTFRIEESAVLFQLN